MKQKTIQEQYNLLQEGKWNEEVFMKHAKQQFPNYIRNAATLNETINSLKHQHLIFEGDLRMGRVITDNPTTQPDWFKTFQEHINEESKYEEEESIQQTIDRLKARLDDPNDGMNVPFIVQKIKRLEQQLDFHTQMDSIAEAKAIEKNPTKEVVDMETKNYDYKDEKNIDNVFGEQFLTGYYCEMKDPKNSEKTIDEIKDIVAKNLAKDRLYYVKDGQFGVKGIGYTDELPGLKASKSDKMEPVKLKENKMISLVDLMESMPLGEKPPSKPKAKKVKKETTDSKLSEIEKNGKIATLEMQIEALEEIISSKSERLSMVSEDESLSELVDKKKMKEMQKEIKLLEKRKAGIEKLYEKMCGKSYTKKEIVDEIQNED